MKPSVVWRNISFGPDRLERAGNLTRHRHLDAYATVVLAGSYEQLSYAGRLRVGAGDILIQPTLDCHSDRALSDTLRLIRLPWRIEATLGGVYRNVRIETIARVANHDISEAASLLEEALIGRSCVSPSVRDWPDKLAIDLGRTPTLQISEWAKSQGLTREYVWRCFSHEFGVAPKRFHVELRTRDACLAIINSCDSLSTIAANTGFSDQAHMTRAIKALTGLRPAQWRSPSSFDISDVADDR